MPHPKKYLVTVEPVEEVEKVEPVEKLPVKEIPLEPASEQPPEKVEEIKVE